MTRANEDLLDRKARKARPALRVRLVLAVLPDRKDRKALRVTQASRDPTANRVNKVCVIFTYLYPNENAHLLSL